MRCENPCGNRIAYFVEFESGRGFLLGFGSVSLAKARQLAVNHARNVTSVS